VYQQQQQQQQQQPQDAELPLGDPIESPKGNSSILH
jgi:hypothetical protein